MSETIEPISQLKDYFQNNKVISLTANNELEFENVGLKLPIDTKTAWIKKDGFYSLGALWYIYLNKDT